MGYVNTLYVVRIPFGYEFHLGMNTQMRIVTTRYESAHRRKPRGYRLWYFQMPDGLTFSYAGSYSQAKQAATAHALRRHRQVYASIQLCA